MHEQTIYPIQTPCALEVKVQPYDWEGLHRRINRLAYTADIKELYDQALDILMEITGAESATFLHFDQDSQELEVEAIRGDPNSLHLIGLRIPCQEALLKTALAANEPIIIGELVNDPRWLRVTSPTSAARLVNLISLPLVSQERLLGVIQIYNFSVANLDYLGSLQERLAIEIERKHLLEAMQQTNNRQRILIEALGQIGGTLDRKNLLQTVLEKSALIAGAERTTIHITDSASKEMSFQLAYEQFPDLFSPSKMGSNRASPFVTETTATNRSIISIPLNTQPNGNSTGEDSTFFGQLMAIKPRKASFSTEEKELLNTLTQHATTFLHAAEIFEGMETLFFDVIEALVASMDAKDSYTQGHSKRVSEYSVLIAKELGLDPTEIHNVRIGSLLHDVGKIGIPDSILKKKGKLTPDEVATVQSHPLTGWKILHQIRLLEPMLLAIIEHHEKLDGSGYPYGLSGNQISIMGRIVAVADVFDAMTSDRPYRASIPIPEVLAYLDENSGTLFDPKCVSALKTTLDRCILESMVM